MHITPVLLQPRLLTIKNRWFKSGRRGLKELAASCISLALMYCIYAATLSALRDATRIAPGVTIDPALLFCVMLTVLSVMIYLSSAVSALGSLFMSKDLDLIASAPITPSQFLLSKTLDVGISVSWMVCVFALPALLAFGVFYEAGSLFIIGAPLLSALLVAIAVTLGIMTALIFAALIPSERARPIFFSLFLIALGASIFLTQSLSDQAPLMSADPARNLERLSSLATRSWPPTTHCARAITALLRGDMMPPLWTTMEGLAFLSALTLCLRLTFSLLYDRGLARTHQTHGFFRIHSRAAQRLSRVLLPFSSAATRAIITKEYKIFSRDLTHTVQLILLLGITFVYLYNYQMLQGPSNVSEDVMAVWRIFLLLSNIALGSLVITSICSRFVFPSVSLEGQSFWLLQAAPVSIHDVLKAKFRSWRIPVSCIGGVIFISGAMALNAEGPLVLASCAAGIIICHGLVGLGIGLGAFFSQFEWEHSTQIATSLGSFIFMITSVIVLSLTMVPLGCMFGIYLLFPESHSTQSAELIIIGSGLLGTYLVNQMASWWALSLGARALRPK
jgi:ABC-2 type transport system permease protein